MITKLIRIINTEFSQWICERYKMQLISNYQEAQYKKFEIQLDMEELQEVINRMQINLVEYLKKQPSEFMDIENSTLDIQEEQSYRSQYENHTSETKPLVSIELSDKSAIHAAKHETASDEEFISEASDIQPLCSQEIENPPSMNKGSLKQTEQPPTVATYEPSDIQPLCSKEIENPTSRNKRKVRKRNNNKYSLKQIEAPTAASSEASDMQPPCSKEIENPPSTSKVKKRKSYSYEGCLKQVENHFICIKCTKKKTTKYSSMRSAKQHIQQAHLGFQFYCKLCDFNCSKQHSYKNHLKNVHKITPKSKNRNKLYEKIGESYKCALCTLTYGSHSGISEHIQIRHLGLNFKCKNCNGEFRTRNLYSKHKKSACKANID